MRRQYSEPGYLKHYIFRWHGDLIPEGEKYPTEEYFQEYVPLASLDDIKAILSDGDMEVSCPEIKATLLAAWGEFDTALCKRLVQQHKLAIRRCPKCNKILESPKAKLCLWCDYNEYESGNNA